MRKKTVYIIGAGASKEVNLPTGYELKSKISRLLDIRFNGGYSPVHGDHKIAEALRYFVQDSSNMRGDINPYLQEAWHIRDALSQAISIDNFIDAHRDNSAIALCGKLGIARSILEAEKSSLLKLTDDIRKPFIDFNGLSKSWYIPFFQLLTENCGKDDLIERFQSITLIIFNYDRCVEHFLFYALQNYYRITAEEAAGLVKYINIFHPYGDVGKLPWSDRSSGIEFGDDPHPEKILKIAEKIKTFSEGTDPEESEIISIRKKMAEADRLVFIGFAFHKLNMQLISPEKTQSNKGTLVKCYATTLGVSSSDKEVIEEQIKNLYSGDLKISMSDVECNQFFKDFWRSLAF